MASNTLLEKYRVLQPNLRKLYVVPLIRYSQPETGYLYNLYRDMLTSGATSEGNIEVESLSVYAHYRFVTGQLGSQPVLLHYHWFEFQDLKAALGIIWKLLCVVMYKLLGGRLIWTIHNRQPHRGRWLRLNYFVRKVMAHMADRLHVHCKSVIPSLRDYFEVPEEKFLVHPHPRFPAHKMQRENTIQQLNNNYGLNLNPDHQLFLHFGNIARYKGILQVVHYFSDLPETNDLIIAGQVKKGNRSYFREIKNNVQHEHNIQLVTGFIPENEVPWFFNSADYIVYNHIHLISSGVIELAKSYQKSIIAPRNGCITEFENNSNIHLFKDQQEFKRKLQALTSS